VDSASLNTWTLKDKFNLYRKKSSNMRKKEKSGAMGRHFEGPLETFKNRVKLKGKRI